MKIFFLLLCITISLNTFGQEVVVVEYELHKEIDLDKTLSSLEQGKEMPDVLNELVKKLLETHSYRLIVNSNESTFDWIEKIRNSQNEGLFSTFSYGDIGLIYKNVENQTYQWATSVFSKDYIVSDSLKTYDWKISKDTKEILGYETRKATAKVDSITTFEAWFAPELPYKNGPEYYGGLPGLILEISDTKINEQIGKRVKTYIAISVNADKKKKIQKPQKGKLISYTEYEQLSKESRDKRKEMFDDGVDKD